MKCKTCKQVGHNSKTCGKKARHGNAEQDRENATAEGPSATTNQQRPKKRMPQPSNLEGEGSGVRKVGKRVAAEKGGTVAKKAGKRVAT